MITVEALIEKKKQNPGVHVVCYVNSSAAVKAESDICCHIIKCIRDRSQVLAKGKLYLFLTSILAILYLPG